MTISPGQTYGTTLGVTSPTNASPGNYTLSVTATNSAATSYSATGYTTYIVVPPATLPGLPVSPIASLPLELEGLYSQLASLINNLSSLINHLQGFIEKLR